MKNLSIADLTGVMSYAMGLIQSYIMAGQENGADSKHWQKIYDMCQDELHRRMEVLMAD